MVLWKTVKWDTVEDAAHPSGWEDQVDQIGHLGCVNLRQCPKVRTGATKLLSFHGPAQCLLFSCLKIPQKCLESTVYR